MRLTSFTDYGLRTLMRLAGETERSFTVREMAEEFGISKDHLTKVVQALAAHSYVKTQRGKSGGVSLAKRPRDIHVGDVVQALETKYRLAECFQEKGCHCTLQVGCRLKKILHKAETAFIAELNRTTLADCAWRPEPRGR